MLDADGEASQAATQQAALGNPGTIYPILDYSRGAPTSPGWIGEWMGVKYDEVANQLRVGSVD